MRSRATHELIANSPLSSWTHEAENDKSRKLWPKPNPPDNYRGSPNAGFDFNTGYGTPEFLFMMR